MEISAITIIDRIKSLISAKDLEGIGYPPQIISNWKSRNTIPKSDDLYKISKFCNVSMEYLLTGEQQENDLPPDESELLRNFRLLDDQTKAMINIQVAALAATK